VGDTWSFLLEEIIMRISRRLGVLAASAAVLAGASITLDAGTASAASACSFPTPTNKADGAFTTWSSTLHSGPATECSGVASIPNGTVFYAWCSYENVYQNVWVYGRIAGTETKGWFYIDDLGYKSGDNTIPWC
jgi:hypothetical protein